MTTANPHVDAVRRELEARAARAAVIIPARDEEQLLPRALDSLARLDAPDGTVVLVHANNCRDGTAAAVRARADRLGGLGLAVVESDYAPPNVGLVRAESAQGAFAAGCRWIAFTDADVEIPDRDFLRVADALAAAEPEGCWSGWCDEFGDLLRGRLGDRPRALLDLARRFRGRHLPRVHPVFRYTDGSNSLVTARGYELAGGYEPKTVGGDSTLGDRYLAATGRFPGFFDRPVVTSARKAWAMGRPGGFIFYPTSQRALESVRASARPDDVSAAGAFHALADDLFAFLYFVAEKRRRWLDLHRMARAVVEAFAPFAGDVTLTLDGDALRLEATEGARRLPLAWDAVAAFWETATLPS